MPEEALETDELRERLEDTAAHAEQHGANGRSQWMVQLSLSTAIIAVFAAIASLQAGAYSNEAILEKNDAVLWQSKASNQWAYYQAKGVKSAVAEVQLQTVGEVTPAWARRLRDQVEHYKAEQDGIQRTAHEFERKVELSNERAKELLDRHHVYARAVTLFQIAIALSAIAALTVKRWLWLAGLALGAAGLLSLVGQIR